MHVLDYFEKINLKQYIEILIERIKQMLLNVSLNRQYYLYLMFIHVFFIYKRDFYKIDYALMALYHNLKI